jgi:hypothetical protein
LRVQGGEQQSLSVVHELPETTHATWASLVPPSVATAAHRPPLQKLPCGQSVSTTHASGFSLLHATSATSAAPSATESVTRRKTGLT